ncbi:MAG TPA: SigE family RNA polymerase sigma factor [Pseudonocardiaceae bacterium]|jgi:RNA polymerase sigma-70 factor (sigma-E family)|nr:SigE family RNA polymerase sigma factor [Pseudonocardiaceae bacterium]
MRREDEDRFREFAVRQAAPLRRCAYLFCGDWHLAEDLMQTSLVKIYRAWPKVTRQDATGNYARTVLLRTWLDEKRRPWRRSEVGRADVPDVIDSGLGPALAAERSWRRDLVHQALLRVPPRQRAVLVLRFFDDLSIAETAEAMRCSEGTVKSQAARGLANLRVAMAQVEADEAHGRVAS